jgi:hypothetical protein
MDGQSRHFLQPKEDFEAMLGNAKSHFQPQHTGGNAATHASDENPKPG